jgi:hypothetical protein
MTQASWALREMGAVVRILFSPVSDTTPNKLESTGREAPTCLGVDHACASGLVWRTAGGGGRRSTQGLGGPLKIAAASGPAAVPAGVFLVEYL